MAQLVGSNSDRQERPHVFGAVARFSSSAKHHPSALDPRPFVPERPLIANK
jgi:hypothetical protein